MPRPRPRLQTVRRHHDARCVFCGVTDPAVLDCHRLLPGSEGGRYTWANTVTACACCHRKLHAGTLKVLGVHPSTFAPRVIHWSDPDGEHWTPG